MRITTFARLRRIEMHAALGLAPITERQRQEMFDDPQFDYLHYILRMS